MQNNIWLFVASLLVPTSTLILTRKSEEAAVVTLFFLGILGIALIFFAFKSINAQTKPLLAGTIFSLTLLPWIIALSAPEISIASFITMWLQPVIMNHSWYISYWVIGALINFGIFFLVALIFVILRNKNRTRWSSPFIATLTLVAFYIVTLFISSRLYEI